MHEAAELALRVADWCQPLPDEAAPCGADLEYDNEFLALTRAAAGKPETQFDSAEPPDWRAVVEGAEALLERSRDLRVAVFWLRGVVRLHGWAGIAPGVALLNGLLSELWEHLHPLPDADDGDLYGRVNALANLAASDGLVGDLRQARVLAERSIGEISGRAVELAAGLSVALEDEAETPRAVLVRMLADAVQKSPDLREHCEAAAAAVRQLVETMRDRLGDEAPSLDPVQALVDAVVGLLPVALGAAEGEQDADDAFNDDGSTPSARTAQGLSGSVRTRDEAMRAIDLVCEFLERTEPANPAPLYLRRGRELMSQNFLQLMKILAPEALNEVARVVGVDPDSVEIPHATRDE